MIDLLLRRGPHGLSLEALRAAPHGVDLGPLVPSRATKVRTPDGRVRLAPAALTGDVPRLARWVAERSASAAGGDGGLVLIGRRHLRSNNSWMHNVRSLVKGPDRSALYVHPTDAARIGIASGDRARVKGRAGELVATVAVTEDVMPGVVSLPHGYGHAEAAETLRVAGALPGANVNAITDDQRVEALIGSSILNGVPVTLARDLTPPIGG